jgi:hypothetical protein
VPDLSYFESYHDFEGHSQYLTDLQAAIPDNSELFVAGDSGEGRPIHGIHLYGADGPGKQAIVWHGTVHAREWIVAPVRVLRSLFILLPIDSFFYFNFFGFAS